MRTLRVLTNSCVAVRSERSALRSSRRARRGRWAKTAAVQTFQNVTWRDERDGSPTWASVWNGEWPKSSGSVMRGRVRGRVCRLRSVARDLRDRWPGSLLPELEPGRVELGDPELAGGLGFAL